MAIQDALQTFRQLVTDTQDARALVRKKVAYGRWRDADPIRSGATRFSPAAAT